MDPITDKFRLRLPLERKLEVMPPHEPIPEPGPVDISSVRKNIISLAIPSIGEFLLSMTIGIVDLAFVGRLGAYATASSGMAWQFVWFVNMVFIGVNAGATAVIARYWGAGDKKNARKAAGQTLLITLILSFICTLMFIFLAEGMFKFLGAGPGVIKYGSAYLRILASTYICASLMMAANTCMKSAGDTKTPMLIVGLLVIMNVFLDYGLIFGKLGLPAHGLLGSAEASAFVMFVGAVLSVGGLFAGRFRIKVKPEDFGRFNWEISRVIIKIGLPISLEHLCWSISAAMVIWVCASLGTVHLAVHNILLKAESLSFMPGLGFSVAAQVAVGQALGEGNEEKARVAASESMKICIAIMGAAGLLFVFFSRQIIGFFTSDPEVLTLGTRTLQILALVQPNQALAYVMLGTMKGAGDTKAALAIGLIGMILVRIPLVYLFGVTLGLGVLGAWGGGMGLDIAVRAWLSYKRFLSGKWIRAL